ncbi:serine/threonine protein kinase [Stratiformator vulcanicus]|uniref:Serine/threonine-protein kinase PknB n=1 Tax=Stratiformator vulcanicus TaxID=2527980 RepID=A0A517QVX9_9PLAN|nr:serine/threonine protein kinase [Stratiformator vulcanicus]QDT35723.1 Serine/threonine-protein kinase PknB [Stratiformator vulcanicus]
MRPDTVSERAKTKSRVGVGHRTVVRSVTRTGSFLRTQLWVWPIIAALTLGLLGLFLRNAIEDTLSKEIGDELVTLVQTDVAAMKLWLNEQERAARSVLEDDTVLRNARELVRLSEAKNTSTADLLQAPQLAELRTEMDPWLHAHNYDGFVVVTDGGRVAASRRDAPVGLTIEQELVDVMRTRMEARGATVLPPFKSRIPLEDEDGTLKSGLPTMFAAAPLNREDGSLAAIFALRIRPEDQFSEILRVARPGESGETYAFDADGLMLSNSRFDPDLRKIALLSFDQDSILNILVRDPGGDMTRGFKPQAQPSEREPTKMVASAVAEGDGYDAVGYRDYRGVRVIGAWVWLPEYDFGIATELDASEAFMALNILRRFFWGMFALLGIAAATIFVFTIFIERANREARSAAIQAKQLGQYALDEKLGEGGMGVVYKAHHAMLQRPTAVKLLHAERTTEEAIARFEREVQITGRLTHPNTIAIYDYGRTPEGVFYYAMELLDGRDCEELVNQAGRLPESRVIYLLRQVCGSLSEAHAVGLIHRDIKPANVFVTVRGGMYDFVKVLDFGLVKAADAGKMSTLTNAGAITGTPLYMPPEMISNPESTDARSDLYMVGAVAYFLLTGRPVVDGGSVIDILRQQAEVVPKKPSQLANREIDSDLEAIVMRCLEKSPADRFQSADELEAALAACRSANQWTRQDAAQWWMENSDEFISPGNLEPPDADEAMAKTMIAVPTESTRQVR